MSWSIRVVGSSVEAALEAFSAAVAADKHAPKDGRLERMAQAGFSARSSDESHSHSSYFVQSHGYTAHGESLTLYWNLSVGVGVTSGVG